VTPSATITPPPSITPFTTASYPIQTVNGDGKWELYNSPNSIRVLLFDGVSMWAGSEAGGLVQWDPQALTAIRHTRASGFPLNTVNDLAYDAASGYLYAVGDAGLAIWDGRQWYHRIQAQLGFEPDTPLTAVAVEKGTVIWVGGALIQEGFGWDGKDPAFRAGGLVHGNWATDTWLLYSTDDGLPSDYINDLSIDPYGNVWVVSGCSWCFLTSGGVTKITPAGDIHTNYLTNHNGAQLKSIDSIATTAGGDIYAGGSDLFLLPPGDSEWVRINTLVQGSLAVDSQGQVWLVLEHGLINLSPQSQETECALSMPGTFNNQLAAAIDGNGHVWFGGETGLFELAGGQVYSRLYLSAPPQKGVYQVAVNGDGTIWFRSADQAGENHYISRILGGQITHFNDERLAIQTAYPWTGLDSFWAVTPDGNLWYADKEALWGYDGKQWKSTAFDPAISGSFSQPVAGPDGLLALTSRAGLSLYRPGVGWQPPTRPDRGMSSWMKLIFKGSDEIWLNSGDELYGNGVVLCYHILTNQWDVFGEEQSGIKAVTYRGISLSPKGDIWGAGFWGELAVYQENGAWVKILDNTKIWDTTGLDEIFFQTGGDAWITTMDWCGFESPCPNGILYYDGSHWVRLTAENSGLISNLVYDIAFDRAGNVWLATAVGLQRTTKP
jgi:sugar lactone lactonase YvrE